VTISGRCFSSSVLLGLASLVAAGSAEAQSQDRGYFATDVEFGAVWSARNDVRIPGDTGTEFDMNDLIGSGPEFFARLGALWQINAVHGVRLVVAPFEVDGSGTLSRETEFAGETFAAGATEATYKFNAYKLSYRYTFYDRAAWRWRAGVTAIIRDANIELRQGALAANDDDLGFVPTLHLSGEYRMSERWRFAFDFDGLAGGPGRLVDLALKVEHDLNDRWRIGAGYRLFEGGVDTDEVYNFGWFNYAVLGVEYRFGGD
jgi:hypothetical protein